MSMSIYYTAKRRKRLTKAESTAIKKIVAEYSVDDQIAKREKTKKGPNWESFCVYDPDEPSASGVIFEGATKLPSNNVQATWTGVQHWCQALSAVRRKLPGAKWSVSVDDHEIQWDSAAKEYDPAQ